MTRTKREDMRLHWLRRSVLSAACGGTALVAGLLFPAAASAAPAPGGQVVVQPADGNDLTQLTLITSGPCGRGTNLVATVFGHGFGQFGQNVIGNSPTSMFATTASRGMIIPLAGTMRYFANIPQVPVVLSGPYRFVVYCRTATGLANLQTFTSRPVSFTTSGSGERIYHTVNPVGVHTTQAKPPADPNPNGSPTTVAGKSAKGHGTGTGTHGGTTAPPRSSGHGVASGAVGAPGTGSSGGISALTTVLSILGALVLAAATGIFLVRRRRPSAGQPLRRPNISSSTH